MLIVPALTSVRMNTRKLVILSVRNGQRWTALFFHLDPGSRRPGFLQQMILLRLVHCEYTSKKNKKQILGMHFVVIFWHIFCCIYITC